MNNISISYLYHENNSASPNMDASPNDILLGKPINKRIIDRTFNPMYWVEATHKFTLSGQYQYTNIRYTDGHQQNITIIDEDYKINKKYKMDDSTTASYIRTELFKLIAASYDPTNFVNSRFLTQIIDHPYPTVEWRDGVTRRITLRTAFEGEISPELQNRFDEHDRIRQAEIQERIRKALEKKSYFEQSSQYNLDEQKFTNQLVIKTDAPILDSADFYNQIIFPNQQKPSLNHDFINIAKEFFRIRDNKYNKSFRWQQQITTPCYYKFGIDQISTSSNTIHENTFYIFFNDSILQNYFKYAKPSKSTTQYIFKHSLGLLYINGYREVNIDDIFFAMLVFIEKYFIQINRHDIKAMDKGVEKEMSFTKLISNIKQMCEEISWIKALNDIRGKSKNGCLFPDRWNEEDKRNWKEINNIERKERKDKGGKHMFTKANDNKSRIGMKYNKKEKTQERIELARRILALQLEGKSYSQIKDILKISKTQISRILKKVAPMIE